VLLPGWLGKPTIDEDALWTTDSNKRVCVADAINPVQKSDQTLNQIRTILLEKYPQLAPLVR
jgi:hypothetical protein